MAYEVSQQSTLVSLTVAAGTVRTTPVFGDLCLMSQGVIAQTTAQAVVVNAGWKKISIHEVVYDVDAFCTSLVTGVTAFSEVGDAIYKDTLAAGSFTVPSRGVGWNIFAQEVGGGNPFPPQEVNAFPARILFRRWGGLQVGSGLAASSGSLRYQNPGNYRMIRVKRRVLLDDDEGLFVRVFATNSTAQSVTITFQVNTVVVWRLLM